MMNPNRLIKLISFAVLCLAVVYPVCAMEQDRGKDKSPDIPSTVAHAKDTYVAYNEASTLDAATDLTDMFDNLYLHNWRCPICLEGTEESSDEVVTLNTCGHKIHRQCISQLLNQGSSATRLCPVCRQEHEMRRNLFAMIEQLYLSANYDPSTIEDVNVVMIVVQDQQRIHCMFQVLKDALDCLSTDRLKQIQDHLQEDFLSPSQALLAQKFITASMQGATQMKEKIDCGITITKQVVREVLAPQFECMNEVFAEGNKSRALLTTLFVRLLREEGKNDFADHLKQVMEECQRFRQEHRAELMRFACEDGVNFCFRQLFSPPNEVYASFAGWVDDCSSILQEAGVSQEERQAMEMQTIAGAVNQLQQDFTANAGIAEQQNEEQQEEGAVPRQEDVCPIQ